MSETATCEVCNQDFEKSAMLGVKSGGQWYYTCTGCIKDRNGADRIFKQVGEQIATLAGGRPMEVTTEAVVLLNERVRKP